LSNRKDQPGWASLGGVAYRDKTYGQGEKHVGKADSSRATSKTPVGDRRESRGGSYGEAQRGRKPGPS